MARRRGRRTDLAHLGRTLADMYQQQSIHLENNLQEAMYTAAKMVESDAKRLAPVDTGMLRASISVRQDGDTFFVGTLTPYAKFVEYGTRFQAPQSFLRKSLYRNKESIKRILEQRARGE